MKYRLIFVILIQWNNAIAQKILEGSYCNSTLYIATCITFYKNNTFEMEINTCTDNSIGHGIYSKRKNKLKLRFNNPILEKKDTSSFSIENKVLRFGEKAKAIIKVYSAKDSIRLNPLHNIFYYIKSNKCIINGFQIDSKDSTQIITREIGLPPINELYVDGGLVYDNISIPIEDEYHQNIAVYLSICDNWENILDSKFNRIYKIKSYYNADTLYLRPSKSKTYIPFIKE